MKNFPLLLKGIFTEYFNPSLSPSLGIIKSDSDHMVIHSELHVMSIANSCVDQYKFISSVSLF